MSLISYQENPEPFLNSYARHAMYPASFIMIHCALMTHRAIAQFGSAPAFGSRMSWVQIPLARQTKKPGISTILGFFFYPTAKRFIRFYPMTVEPILPCGLRDFCDVGTPPASQFDSMRHRFPLPNLK